MSVITEALNAIRETIKLADDVKRTAETVKDVAKELREHDRRITRLEAQWETAMALTQLTQMGRGHPAGAKQIK